MIILCLVKDQLRPIPVKKKQGHFNVSVIEAFTPKMYVYMTQSWFNEAFTPKMYVYMTRVYDTELV